MSYNTTDNTILNMMQEVGFEPQCNKHYSTTTNLIEDMCGMIKTLLSEVSRLQGLIGSQAPELPAFTPVIELSANHANAQGVAVVEPYGSTNYIVVSPVIRSVEVSEININRESTVRVSMSREMSDEMIMCACVVRSISHNKNMRNRSASGEGMFVKGYKCDWGQRGWSAAQIVHQESQAVDRGEASLMEAINGVEALAADVYFTTKTIAIAQPNAFTGAVELTGNTNISIAFATTNIVNCYANIKTLDEMKIGSVVNAKLRVGNNGSNNCRAIVTLNGDVIATLIKNVGEYPNGVKLTKTDVGFDTVFLKDGVVIDYTFRDRTTAALATIGESVTAVQTAADTANDNFVYDNITLTTLKNDIRDINANVVKNTNIIITAEVTTIDNNKVNIKDLAMKIGHKINVKLRAPGNDNNCAKILINRTEIAFLKMNVGDIPNGVTLTKTDVGFDTVFLKDGVVIDYTFRDRTTAALVTIGESVTAVQQAADAANNNITTINTALNHSTNGLAAAHTKANTATTNITTINSTLNHSTNGLAAAHTKANTATTNITTINTTLNNSTTGLAATYTKAAAAQTAADNSITDITVENNALRKVRKYTNSIIPFSYIKDVGLNPDKSIKVTKISTAGQAINASLNVSTGIIDKPIGWDQIDGGKS